MTQKLSLRSKIAFNLTIILKFSYTIKDVQEWEAGEYKCVATVNGFPSKYLLHELHLKGNLINFEFIFKDHLLFI